MRVSSQPGILDASPRAGTFLSFDLRALGAARTALRELGEDLHPAGLVLGVGEPLVRALGANVPGLRPFPSVSGVGCAFPATQRALFAFVGGNSPSECFDREGELCRRLHDAFVVRDRTQAFCHREGRDLSGYVDGTANPEGQAAHTAAIVAGAGMGLDGGSFLAVQKWAHDLESFRSLPEWERDAIIGRRVCDNAEIRDAPMSAHVKRTEQESFDPAVFLVRRSMPWALGDTNGLYFAAYGASLDGFERMLTRMSGQDDGVPDALLRLSRALSGDYYFCPPLADDRLDLRAVL